MSGAGGVPHFMGNIFRGRGRQQQQQRQQPNNNNNNPFQNVFGGVFDAAAAAAAGAFQQEQFGHQQQQQQPSNPIPPASAHVLQQLPEVRVIREDLVDPANRVCCICLEAIDLGSKVTRLPCAHLYHKPCITDWLRRNCTCPTCRFELPTDDGDFERGRRGRMGHRKPRYARYQLHNLSLGELRRLVTNRNKCIPDHIKDKAALVDFVIEEHCVEEIPISKDVVRYRMSELEHMKISKLKHAMNEEAGVFFEDSEVVEKKDMIRIFQDSGRLEIVAEPDREEGSSNDSPVTVSTDDEEEQEQEEFATEKEDRKPASKPSAVVVETVYSDLDDDNDDDDNDNNDAFVSPRIHPDLVMEENLSFRAQNARARRPSGPEASSNENCVSSSAAAARASTTQSTCTSAANNENPSAPVAAAAPSVAARPAASATATSNERIRDSLQKLNISEIQAVAREKGVDISDLLPEFSRLDSLLAERLGSTERTSSTASNSNGGVGSEDDDQYREYVSPEQRRRSKRHRSREPNADDLHTFSYGSDDEEEPNSLRDFLQGLSISQLQAIAREKSVELAGVIEKEEILDRLVSSWAPPANGGGTNNNAPASSSSSSRTSSA